MSKRPVTKDAISNSMPARLKYDSKDKESAKKSSKAEKTSHNSEDYQEETKVSLIFND